MPATSMQYLVVIHIPFARDADGSALTGDMWLRDLRGMAHAIGPITVAAPCVVPEKLTARGAGSFSVGRVAADDAQLRFLPLPEYDSAGSLLRAARSTWKLLRNYVAQADIVHIDSGGWPVAQGQFGFLLARQMKKKIMLFLGDGADPIGRFQEKLRRDRSPFKKFTTWVLMKQFHSFFRHAARCADVTFFHNPITESRFARFARTRQTFFRTFVDRDILLTAEQLEARSNCLMTDQPLRLIMAGRLIAMKGIHHAIMALHLARQHGVNVELTILGSGEEESRLRQQAVDSGITEHVHFRGTVAYGPLLFDILKDHHGLVVCNLTDEISRNVLLAMACGLVLISYDNPATRTLLVHRENALVVPSGNVPLLGNSIAHLASDRVSGAKLLRGGWNTAAQHTFEACHETRAAYARRITSTPSTTTPLSAPAAT